jgi:hypothetical protein
MSDNFQPSEEAIDRVLAKASPRQIAIAYLRAVRRTKALQARLDMLVAINGIAADLREAQEDQPFDPRLR